MHYLPKMDSPVFTSHCYQRPFVRTNHADVDLIQVLDTHLRSCSLPSQWITEHSYTAYLVSSNQTFTHHLHQTKQFIVLRVCRCYVRHCRTGFLCLFVPLQLRFNCIRFDLLFGHKVNYSLVLFLALVHQIVVINTKIDQISIRSNIFLYFVNNKEAPFRMIQIVNLYLGIMLRTLCNQNGKVVFSTANGCCLYS